MLQLKLLRRISSEAMTRERFKTEEKNQNPRQSGRF
jgi:hypothetical protein